MRTVGVGAKKKSNELDELKKANSELEAKLAEATAYAEARDKQIEELEAKLAKQEKAAKPSKSEEKKEVATEK